MLAIEVENLTKNFNGFVAVDNVSFSIKSGEIFGLLGPNGAGKTTIISMLSTLLKPTSGSALVNNFEISNKEDDVRRSIGIVFQDQSLDEELTAYENMDFHGRLYRIPKWDKQFGFLNETLVAPVSRMEIMFGQTLGGATTAFIQGFIILVLSLFMGLSITSVSGFLIAFVS